MSVKFERPLQEEELKILNRNLSNAKIRLSNQVKFCVVWMLLALIIGGYAFFHISPEDKIVLYLTVAGYVGVGVWVGVEQQTSSTKLIKNINFLKKKNLVTVIKVCSDAFYQLEEEDDEGAFYLFQLDNNKVFSFGGQNFYENENFPNNNFEIVEGRGINNKLLLLETCVYGEKIKPSKIINKKEKWLLLERADYPDPEKMTIVEGRIEDYLQ